MFQKNKNRGYSHLTIPPFLDYYASERRKNGDDQINGWFKKKDFLNKAPSRREDHLRQSLQEEWKDYSWAYGGNSGERGLALRKEGFFRKG